MGNLVGVAEVIFIIFRSMYSYTYLCNSFFIFLNLDS